MLLAGGMVSTSNILRQQRSHIIIRKCEEISLFFASIKEISGSNQAKYMTRYVRREYYLINIINYS
jgi:hypothetical protein